jgi:soluble lytic murein transglycosylase
MTIRTCLAKPIPALWFGSAALLACVALWQAAPASAATRKRTPGKPAPARPVSSDLASPLAGLVQAYRETPTPGRRAAVESYAAAHGKDRTGALARLALGITDYEQTHYPAAVGELKPVQAKLPEIADYAAYYLAAARVESNDTTVSARDLAPAHPAAAPSPVSGKAWLVEARALKTPDAAAAIRLLRSHYADLPQPDGDLALADCYQAAGDLPNAADFYQRVYFQYVAGDAAVRSAAALVALKDTMGAAYPPPLPEQKLRRADRLLELREYAAARSEYQALLSQLTNAPQDRARVSLGAVDFLTGATSLAYSYLRDLEVGDSEAAAERLYYIAECARHLNNEDAMMAAVKELAAKCPDSPWRLKALVSVANRYLLVNRPDDYVPLYQAAYESFPAAPAAALCHWKVTFHQYLHGAVNAADLLAEHLRNYPGHYTAGAALYFLGRGSERQTDPAAARAAYQLLVQTFENTYYAMLARDRLRSPEVAGGSQMEGAAKTAAAAQWLSNLTFPVARSVPAESSQATALRIARSRLLRSAGLADLADSELRFGARTDGQAPLLAMESAAAAEAPHRAMRIMKTMTPDYLGLPVQSAPRKFWELLFPLPYRADLVQSAQAREIDPYLLAGLIRQESEFNPEAISPAKAYGLTQVRPATGRQYARQAGVERFTTRALYQPAVNLKIGCSILRGMLNHNNGSLEQTLAAYNAGPARVAEWLTWNTYREPAEFVESIPFTETRDYVQAVLRNAEMYRRLYEGVAKAAEEKPGAKPAPARKSGL